MEKKISYAEAINEIEAIIAKLNNETIDVDQLAAQIKRANELITLCKEKLRKAELEVNSVINKAE